MNSVAAVVAGIDAGADPMQATVDAFAPTFECGRPARMAERTLVLGPPIETTLDPGATTIEAVLDAFAAVVALVALVGQGRDREQAHGQGQDKPGQGFHRAVSFGCGQRQERLGAETVDRWSRRRGLRL
jgi:hypothetical protein